MCSKPAHDVSYPALLFVARSKAPDSLMIAATTSQMWYIVRADRVWQKKYYCEFKSRKISCRQKTRGCNTDLRYFRRNSITTCWKDLIGNLLCQKIAQPHYSCSDDCFFIILEVHVSKIHRQRRRKYWIDVSLDTTSCSLKVQRSRKIDMLVHRGYNWSCWKICSCIEVHVGQGNPHSHSANHS